MSTDLFGDKRESPDRPKASGEDPYADRAYDYETCWEDCTHCEKTLYSQDHKNPKCRIFRFCGHPLNGRARQFEWSGLCERCSRKPVEKPLKPDTPGWEDY